jgi:hypothetical protein
MATFYVLPSRYTLGQRYGEFLTTLFPDARFSAGDSPDLAESLAALIEGHGGHVIFREDLDDALPVRDALLRDFGAELEDELIEVHFGAGLNQVLHQRWATERHRSAA